LKNLAIAPEGNEKNKVLNFCHPENLKKIILKYKMKIFVFEI
jgi:hypothetical protein